MIPIPVPVGRNGGRSVQRIAVEKDGVDADVGHDDADDGDNDDVVGVDVAAGRPDVSERDGNDRRRRSVDRRSELDEKPTQGRTIQVKDQSDNSLLRFKWKRGHFIWTNITLTTEIHILSRLRCV